MMDGGGKDRRGDMIVNQAENVTMDCELLTLEQAAQYLGLTEGNTNPGECVRWLCRKREVKFAKIGKRIRFKRVWLDAYVESQTVAPIRRGKI